MSVERDHPHRMGIFPIDDVLDDRVFVGFVLIGFSISAAKPSTKLVEYEMNDNVIFILRLARMRFSVHTGVTLAPRWIVTPWR
jgi:hypothetical protein